jgi:hypothetical protein
MKIGLVLPRCSEQMRKGSMRVPAAATQHWNEYDGAG